MGVELLVLGPDFETLGGVLADLTYGSFTAMWTRFHGVEKVEFQHVH